MGYECTFCLLWVRLELSDSDLVRFRDTLRMHVHELDDAAVETYDDGGPLEKCLLVASAPFVIELVRVANGLWRAVRLIHGWSRHTWDTLPDVREIIGCFDGELEGIVETCDDLCLPVWTSSSTFETKRAPVPTFPAVDPSDPDAGTAIAAYLESRNGPIPTYEKDWEELSRMLPAPTSPEVFARWCDALPSGWADVLCTLPQAPYEVVVSRLDRGRRASMREPYGWSHAHKLAARLLAPPDPPPEVIAFLAEEAPLQLLRDRRCPRALLDQALQAPSDHQLQLLSENPALALADWRRMLGSSVAERSARVGVLAGAGLPRSLYDEILAAGSHEELQRLAYNPCSTAADLEQILAKTGGDWLTNAWIAKHANAPYHVLSSLVRRWASDPDGQSHPIEEILLHPRTDDALRTIIADTALGLGDMRTLHKVFRSPWTGPRPLHLQHPPYLDAASRRNWFGVMLDSAAPIERRVDALERLLSYPGDLAHRWYSGSDPWLPYETPPELIAPFLARATDPAGPITGSLACPPPSAEERLFAVVRHWATPLAPRDEAWARLTPHLDPAWSDVPWPCEATSETD